MKINPEIVNLIYDVPLGLSSWNDVALAMQNEFNTAIGAFFIVRPNQLPLLISTINRDESIWQLYEAHFCNIDPWNAKILSGDSPINFCAPDDFFLDRKSLCNTEFYNDFWRLLGLAYTAGGMITTKNYITVNLAFPRDKTAGAYTEEEGWAMNYYAQNMRRALELEGMIGTTLPRPIYEHALATSFGFTAAETRMVLALYKVSALPAVAKNLNLSYHTVRSQMKSVLIKTETKNQLELMRFLMTDKRAKGLN